MAKGQIRNTKEQRKKKSTDKKHELPRYMRGTEAGAIGKATALRTDQKK